MLIEKEWTNLVTKNNILTTIVKWQQQFLRFFVNIECEWKLFDLGWTKNYQTFCSLCMRNTCGDHQRMATASVRRHLPSQAFCHLYSCHRDRCDSQMSSTPLLPYHNKIMQITLRVLHLRKCVSQPVNYKIIILYWGLYIVLVWLTDWLILLNSLAA